MKDLTFGKGLGLTRDMKKAIQRNTKEDEYLSTLVRQLDKEKRTAFNQLSDKKEAFAKETAKRRLSLPIIEKTGSRKGSLVNCGRRKAFSVDEGKGASFLLHFPERLLSHQRLPENPSNRQRPKLSNVSAQSFEKRRDSRNLANETDNTSLTSEESNICRFPRLTFEKGKENVQAQQRGFKPRRVSILAAAPSRNDAKMLQRRATLHIL